MYDGHGGKYVAQYLKDHLTKRFCQQLQVNGCVESSSDASGSGMEKLDKIRISLKEAICKIDREILLTDSEKIEQAATFRHQSLQGHVAGHRRHDDTVTVPIPGPASAAMRAAVTDSSLYAGSCAVVAVVYHSKNVDRLNDLPPSHMQSSHSLLQPPASSTPGFSSLCPSALQQHANESSSLSLRALKSLPRFGSFASREREKKMLRRVSTYSTEGGDDYSALSYYDIDNDKTLEQRSQLAQNNNSNNNTTINNNTKTLQNASALSLLSDLTASFRSYHRHESFMSNFSDDIPQQFSPNMSPKHCEILMAVRDDALDVSLFEIEDLHDLAMNLKQKSTEYQKFADDCNSQATTIFEVIHKHHTSPSLTADETVETKEGVGNNAEERSLSSGNGGDCSSLEKSSDCSSSLEKSGGTEYSPTLSLRNSLTSLTPKTSPGGSSCGSLTSLKSFGEGDSVDLNPRKSLKHLSNLPTVTEGNMESRSTSFATTQYASQESYISTRNDNDHIASSRGLWHRQPSEHDVKLREPDCCILIAHVGDCRAVLCDRGVAIQLTEDHTPMLADEVARIKASGGFVSKKRVNGFLAVSRSFGDIKYKDFDAAVPPPESWMDEETHGIWSNKNAVISMPDFLELCIQPTYEFIILASDGLWSVFSCVEAVLLVRAELLAHGQAMEAAQALVTQASKEGAVDNVSAVVVCLNQT